MQIQKLKEKTVLSRKKLLMNIIGSGINITPNALNILLKLKINGEDLRKIIREISFLPDFSSHITVDILKQTSLAPRLEQFSNDLVRTSLKSKNTLQNLQGNNLDSKTDISEKKVNKIQTNQIPNNRRNISNFRNNKHSDLINSENDALSELLGGDEKIDSSMKHDKQKKDREIANQNIRQKLPTTNKVKAFTTNKQKLPNSQTKSSVQHDDDLSINSRPESSIISKSAINSKSKTEKKINNAEIPTSENNLTNNQTVSVKQRNENRYNKLQRESMKVFHIENRKNTNRFKPIASEYYDDVRIIKDPNKNLYTSGNIDEFHKLIKSRYDQLSKLFKNHPDVRNVMRIIEINNKTTNDEVGLIGMVVEKKVIGEKRHYKLFLEDPTGVTSVLVLNNDNNIQLYSRLEHLVIDQVVYVSGSYRYDKNKHSGIIFADNVLWPDIPVGNNPQIPDIPISIALISDVHIGSKNFTAKSFERFLSYLKCEIGTEKQMQLAGSVKYLVIQGDLVDGIGIYPAQEKELAIPDIYDQYSEAAKYLSQLPDYIKVIYIPGNHEPVRNALPHPNVPKKYCRELLDQGVIMSGNPSLISLSGIKTLCYHGDSMIDMIVSIPGLTNDKPEDVMEEFLRCRHLAPIYGGKTEIAPLSTDWLVIDEIPHLFHAGHVHINGIKSYRGVLNVNSGCFQSQTEFMKSLGIVPTPGIPVFVKPKNGRLDAIAMNFND